MNTHGNTFTLLLIIPVKILKNQHKRRGNWILCNIFYKVSEYRYNYNTSTAKVQTTEKRGLIVNES